MLLLSSMFGFAFVFHAVMQPGAQLPARYDRQLAAFPVPAAADRPAVVSARSTAVARPQIVVIATVGEPAVAPPAAPPLLNAFAWPAMPAALPAAAAASRPSDAERHSGAVTNAFATTRSALRGAFRKTF